MDDGALSSRWAEYERRVPSSLEDLRGQATGLVELPLHVAWSGRRVYDVGDDDQRLLLYALLLAEAQREDLERFVHRESLVSMWPRLRRLLGPHARREWERKLMTPACRCAWRACLPRTCESCLMAGPSSDATACCWQAGMPSGPF